MSLFTLDPSELAELTDKQLRDYRATLDLWKTVRGPWAAHREHAQWEEARSYVEVEEGRRGVQSPLW